MSLPDSFRQSMTTARANMLKKVFMDARNKSGHDNEGVHTFASQH